MPFIPMKNNGVAIFFVCISCCLAQNPLTKYLTLSFFWEGVGWGENTGRLGEHFGQETVRIKKVPGAWPVRNTKVKIGCQAPPTERPSVPWRFKSKLDGHLCKLTAQPSAWGHEHLKSSGKIYMFLGQLKKILNFWIAFKQAFQPPRLSRGIRGTDH